MNLNAPTLPITLKDVASASGYGESTVSYALRNHPKIPSSTRNKIQQVAESLGYRPDPSMRQLMAHLRKGRERNITQAIGFLNTTPKARHAEMGYRFRRVWEAVEAEAGSQGYHVDEFDVPDLLRKGRSLESILKSRNIRGLLLYHYPAENLLEDFHWDEFACSSIDKSPPGVAMDTVIHSSFRGMRTAIHELRKLGYKRIGVVMDNPRQGIARDQWTASYLFECMNDPGLQPLPLYRGELRPGGRVEEVSRKGFLQWYHEHKPDCVLDYDRERLQWLQDAGISVPKDCGFTLLNVEPEFDEISGVDQRMDLLARHAVQHLLTSLESQRMGLPELPAHVRIEGSWNTGRTLRKVS